MPVAVPGKAVRFQGVPLDDELKPYAAAAPGQPGYPPPAAAAAAAGRRPGQPAEERRTFGDAQNAVSKNSSAYQHLDPEYQRDARIVLRALARELQEGGMKARMSHNAEQIRDHFFASKEVPTDDILEVALVMQYIVVRSNPKNITQEQDVTQYLPKEAIEPFKLYWKDSIETGGMRMKVENIFSTHPGAGMINWAPPSL